LAGIGFLVFRVGACAGWCFPCLLYFRAWDSRPELERHSLYAADSRLPYLVHALSFVFAVSGSIFGLAMGLWYQFGTGTFNILCLIAFNQV
jgi:hypothetical protein